MTATEFDLFVIGAGSGGVRAARIAASYGARVAIAEEDRFGGTCVIRGCVPKKLLVYASRFSDDFADAAGFGWTVDRPVFDWHRLIAAKDQELARLEAIYKATLRNCGVNVFAERAVVTGANSVRLTGSGRDISASSILVATGGQPDRPPQFPGSNFAITSNEAFYLDKFPRRIVIAGGGYIAVEFASILHGLGSDVTLIIRGDKILRGFDDACRDALQEALINRGIKLVPSQTIAGIEAIDGAYRTELSGGAVFDVDQVMFAIGRTPNTWGLGLEAAGVSLTDNGAVVVDQFSRSSVPTIYAVGDVTDRMNLTPVAIREGHALADYLYGGGIETARTTVTPTAVFSTPEVASVGLTETEARALHGDIDVYQTNFRPMKATLSGRQQRVLMKLLVHPVTRRVVGCHMVGGDAAEIIQMAAIAIEMGATKHDFDRTLAVHPTAGEEFVTMRDRWEPPAIPAK